MTEQDLELLQEIEEDFSKEILEELAGMVEPENWIRTVRRNNYDR